MSLNSFSLNTCIISPMISKYLILMSMTCAETQEMTPRGLLQTEAPLFRPDSLDCDHSTDYSLSGYSKNFTSRRSLPSCRRCASGFRMRRFHPLQTLVLFHGFPVHLVMLRLVLRPSPRDLHHHQSLIVTGVKPYIIASRLKCSDREHNYTRIYL